LWSQLLCIGRRRAYDVHTFLRCARPPSSASRRRAARCMHRSRPSEACSRWPLDRPADSLERNPTTTPMPHGMVLLPLHAAPSPGAITDASVPVLCGGAGPAARAQGPLLLAPYCWRCGWWRRGQGPPAPPGGHTKWRRCAALRHCLVLISGCLPDACQPVPQVVVHTSRAYGCGMGKEGSQHSLCAGMHRPVKALGTSGPFNLQVHRCAGHVATHSLPSAPPAAGTAMGVASSAGAALATAGIAATLPRAAAGAVAATPQMAVKGGKNAVYGAALVQATGGGLGGARLAVNGHDES
jgi:hypothetical protein